MSPEVIDHLKSLHTSDIDAINGYEEARRDAEGHGMTPLFQELIVVHTRNADDLAIALRRAGEFADDEGSFMSTLHRTIMSVRSLFGGLGESVIPGLIDGEKRNISHYDHVLESRDLPEVTGRVLLINRARLQDALEHLQSLAPEKG
jgi:uncharacterized protein (TIGR02284 family)